MVRVLTKIRYHVKSGFRHGFKNIIFSKFFFGFVASIGVILSSHDKTGRIKDNLNARLHDTEDTFDFVIVGGGTAGSLLANRLSEQHKVLVLEAGGEPHPLQRIPGMALFMLNYRETDWMHRTVPQRRACFSSPGRRAGWCGGRNLGGSSNINYMVHMRGSPRDFDNWAKITGDQSWSYEALLHYFRRHENYQGDSPDREAHGFDGDMMLEGPSYTGMAKEFIRAGQELGYEHVDLNARFEEGFDSIYSPMEMGERKASFHAFLEPVRDRETLTVRKYSRVTKILIRSFDNTAFGVEYERHGVKKQAYATKEVILCAGAVESPKLLMLSGIGPKTHLADLGIPVVADLPVGKNLQDHLAVVLGPFFVDPPRSFLIDRDITLKSFYEYKSDGNGPLSTSIFQAAGMISSKRAKVSQEWNWPDILLLLSGMAGHKTFARDMAHAFNLNQKLIKKYYHHAAGRDSFIIFVSAARPQGRGDVTLEKKDSDAPPSINPHYLENESDMKITLEGIKTALYLVENTTSFQNLRARFTNKKFPGCDHMPFRSDEYWECYTRHFSVSLNDGAGTCAMGNPAWNLFGEGNGWGKDLPGGSAFLGAVVDPKLQVIGINHLRVADASIMPQITGSQTQAATLMIAEKAADTINEAWNGNGDGPQATTYKPFGWSEQMPAGAPQQHLGPPPQTQYGPPQDPIPPSNTYGPPTPPQSSYGPPPQQQYGPPMSPQNQQYGPPQNNQQYGPPVATQNQQYGPPQNNQQYGPPPQQQQYGPPAPPQNQQYGPPMPPQNQQYGPPMPSQQQYGPPMPPQNQQYGPPMPPPNQQYGAPMPPMMNGGGGYMDMTTSSEPPMEMPMGNMGESQQMSEVDEATEMTPDDETTTMMTTTTMGTTMTSTPMSTTTSMEPPVSYGPPMDSQMETTTLIPNHQYGPPQQAYGVPDTYNGWSGAGYLDSQQYGVPPLQNNEISQNGPNNSPAPFFTPPGQDTTTAASSTTQITSTEDFGKEPPVFLTPPGPGERGEPPYQPQIGNPLFGGGQDPRNIPPAGDPDTMSSTTMSTGSDPPEENAPAGGAYNPVFTSGDSATSETSAVESSTFRSFYTDNPSGSSSGSSTAAARPDVGFLEHETKLRPGVQISNPFPDIFYATQDGGTGPSGDESYFQKYPLTSSVEFGNKIPSLPKISNGPVFFGKPDFTSRRPLVFGELLKKETSAPANEVMVDTTPYPFISTKVQHHFNKSAVATSRASAEMPPYVPYYNDKNRRPDEGTVKPTILYKSFGQTNKVPSTANVPNIYYSVKDKVSKEGLLFGDDELMTTSDGPPVMFAPTGPPPPPLRTSPSPIPAGVSGTSAGFGGSAQSSSNAASYWTNASPKPDVTDNMIPVEVQHGKDSAKGYWTNASPKPKLVGTPRGLGSDVLASDNDDDFGDFQSSSKRPGRLRALRRKPKGRDGEENKRSRIVRIKPEIVWTTTQRPALTTTFHPKSLRGSDMDESPAGKMKIRVRTKEVALKEELDDPEVPILSPYWSQGNRTTVPTTKRATTTSKPDELVISGTSSPTTAIYKYYRTAIPSTSESMVTVTPRPMLSVQVYPSSDKKMEQAPPIPEGGMSATMATLADDSGMYLSHPGFGFDKGPESHSAVSWQDTHMNEGHQDDNMMGVASVLPASAHGEDQTPGETLLLSNIFGSVLRGGGTRRRRPPLPAPPDATPHSSHYDGTIMITGSTDRPPHLPLDSTFATSGNSAIRFMPTQVPEFFMQDDPEGPRGLEEGNRKRFTAQDGKQEDYGPTGSTSPQQYQEASHHHLTGPTGHFGNPQEVLPPHHFDSGERNRFNLFNDGVSSTVQPPHNQHYSPQQPADQHSNAYPHRDHHLPPHSSTTNHLHQDSYDKTLAHFPPPLNPNFQVTTPGNDFSSPAYDENPLQFYKDATPQIPDRFQVGPTKTPSQTPAPPPPLRHNNDYPTESNGNYQLHQHQNNHHGHNNYNDNNQHLQSSPSPPPPPPRFIENSGELGPAQFGSGGFSAQTNNIGSSFPSPAPTPSNPPPLSPSPAGFGLGHSAPSLAGGNSPPPLRGIHHTRPHPFELPARFAGAIGLDLPENTLPSPPNDDLGQIPDIFGFRNVLPSTVPPPVISAPPPTLPLPHPHEQNRPPSTPNYQEEFSVPQFLDFSSPPTTELQHSIHNILSSTSPGPAPTAIGLPSSGSSDLPKYLGESRPKVYEDGVDPNKISLTYDDTGANGFLDPPVIMGSHNSKKQHSNVDINQISLTRTPGQTELPPNQQHSQFDGPFHGEASRGHSPPTGTSGQESKHEDVTQTREQILSQFGPQQDPEDHAQGDLLTPNLGTRQPEHHRHRQPTRRPFGEKLHNRDRDRTRERLPFEQFEDANLFQNNPFADLLLPQKDLRQQVLNQHGQNHAQQQVRPNSSTQPPRHEHREQQHQEFRGPTPHPADGFSVTPFETPDFTRFELGHQTGNEFNQFPSSVAPPPAHNSGGSIENTRSRGKMKEYTIYSNPDDVDITIDQGAESTSAAPANNRFSNNNGHGQGGLRRRVDNIHPNGRRRKRRRHHGRGQQQSTSRGGRALKLRPLWGGNSGVPMKGRRRYYMLKQQEKNRGNQTRTTTMRSPISTTSGIGEVFQKRTSMERSPVGTNETAYGMEDPDLAALSQELLQSFLGFGAGDDAELHKDILAQLLRNSTARPPLLKGGGMGSTEEDLDDSSAADPSHLSMEEELFMFTSTSTTVSTPLNLHITPATNLTSEKPTEWTPVEAATTNATITLSAESETIAMMPKNSPGRVYGHVVRSSTNTTIEAG